MTRDISPYIELPESRYGIKYTMKKETEGMQAKKTTHQSLRRWMSFPTKRFHNVSRRMSPFERLMEELNHIVLKDKHPVGTALMYIREIFEPTDAEFPLLDVEVDVRHLSQDQVNRLRIMIVPKRREEILLAFLDYYGAKNGGIAQAASNVIKHFNGFKRRYATVNDIKEKLDLLFGFRTQSNCTQDGCLVKKICEPEKR